MSCAQRSREDSATCRRGPRKAIHRFIRLRLPAGIQQSRMPLRQGVCQASPLSAHLLSLPFLQSGIAIHDLGDLAAIKAQPAAALARLPFTVEQPNHAQRLPCVVARAEGAVGFFTGLFKLVEVNPALDGLRRAITEFLLQLGDPVPELGFSGVALTLPGPGEIPP